MLRSVLPLALLAGAAAFAPGAVLPSTSRNVAAVGPTMQRIGSARPAGGSTGGQGSQGKQGSMAGRLGSAGRQGSVTPQRTGSMIPQRQASVAPVAKKAKTAEEDKKGKEKEEAAEDLPCTTPNPQFPEAHCPRHMHVLSTNITDTRGDGLQSRLQRERERAEFDHPDR